MVRYLQIVVKFAINAIALALGAYLVGALVSLIFLGGSLSNLSSDQLVPLAVAPGLAATLGAAFGSGLANHRILKSKRLGIPNFLSASAATIVWAFWLIILASLEQGGLAGIDSSQWLLVIFVHSAISALFVVGGHMWSSGDFWKNYER